MKTIYKIILTALAILLFCLLVGAYFDLKKNLETSRENTSQLLNETRLNKELYLTRDQFNGLLSNSNKSLLKTILDSFNVKTKHISRTVNNSYYYHYKDTVVQAEKVDSLYKTNYAPDSCISFDVSFDFMNESFIFENVVLNYESESIYFKIRETKKGKRIFWPFGKLRLKAKTLNNCTGESKITEINIIK
jgi:hypothetical protein